jgi:hypothetical protein
MSGSERGVEFHPAPRNSAVRRMSVGALGVLAAFALAALLLAPGSAPGVASAGLTTAASIPPWNTWTCNPNDASPAALSIPVANIGQARVAGTVIGATYEYQVLNYTPADRGTQVYLPTAEAVFPTANASLTVTISPRNLSLANGHWSLPVTLSASRTLTARETWGASSAYLSTEKYAVMANASSGSLTLAFRWHWSVTPVGGATKNGTWTVPSRIAPSGFLPSIFYPAPLVTLGAVSFQGTTMTLPLGGTVANTSFRVVLEYPNNGTEIQSVWENTTLHATAFNATLSVTYRDGIALPNGSYLTHVHDVCEAIVHMHSVTVANGVPSAPIAGPLRT